MDRCLDGIDWNDVWKAKKARNRALKKGHEPDKHWEDIREARRYAEEADAEYQKRIHDELAILPLTPQSRILDIGAGPGPLSLPLAKKAAHVMAIEPATGMVTVLAERIEKAGLSNVSWVQKRWEDIDPDIDLSPPYDLVIASFSLVMDDIQAAIEKVHHVVQGSVYLFDFIDGPLWEQLACDIWSDLHGEPYSPGPKADCLWNVLYQMGIYANVLVRPIWKSYRFVDVTEAAEFFSRRFGADEDSQKETLKRYLSGKNMAGNGSFYLRGEAYYATIWYEYPQRLP
jgi:SAM-dependent methyltransferase